MPESLRSYKSRILIEDTQNSGLIVFGVLLPIVLIIIVGFSCYLIRKYKRRKSTNKVKPHKESINLNLAGDLSGDDSKRERTDITLDRTISSALDGQSESKRKNNPHQGELLTISVNRASSNSDQDESRRISRVTEIHYLCPQEEDYISPTERIPDHFDIYEFRDITGEVCNVCNSVFEKGDMGLAGECRHKIHLSCWAEFIQKHRDKSMLCPICCNKS
ncbi:unnamed protein product [Blepharisma stoltei]|uniref:RING-type domain-containing protein n=1 Tax=Blepharisma stoltei TaxID=1481888 RepID=A0AAU9IVP7_9CILI|nr:unnamed protein product [Blepharisma stoltei]